MLLWEHQLAPARQLAALNQAGYSRGFGAGNRIVVAAQDVAALSEAATFAGWDGIYRGHGQSAAPFWFIQQSIVRELIPEGVDPGDYPGHRAYRRLWAARAFARRAFRLCQPGRLYTI